MFEMLLICHKINFNTCTVHTKNIFFSKFSQISIIWNSTLLTPLPFTWYIIATMMGWKYILRGDVAKHHHEGWWPDLPVPKGALYKLHWYFNSFPPTPLFWESYSILFCVLCWFQFAQHVLYVGKFWMKIIHIGAYIEN